jgi:hypothetical protein
VLLKSRTTQRVRSQRQIQCSQQKLAGCCSLQNQTGRRDPHGGARWTSALAHLGLRPRARAKTNGGEGSCSFRHSSWRCGRQDRVVLPSTSSVAAACNAETLHVDPVQVPRYVPALPYSFGFCMGRRSSQYLQIGMNNPTIPAQLSQMSSLIGCLIKTFGYLLHS